MKKLIVSAAILAFSAGVAYADKPNDKGAGGQAVKEVNEILKASGTNLGQAKKDAGVSGKEWGEAVSGLNQDSNH